MPLKLDSRDAGFADAFAAFALGHLARALPGARRVL